MTIFDFLIRLGAALLFGALIGIERQSRQRMAGLRITVLVAAGSMIFEKRKNCDRRELENY